jgi:hypothetical protein
MVMGKRKVWVEPFRGEWTAEEKAEAFAGVLELMAEGETLDEAVKNLARPCTPGAMRKWIAADEAWVVQYARAKRLLAQAWAEEAVKIARNSTSSTTAMDRVLIDTLKWAAAKANPAEFGEKQTVEHQGSQTLQVRVVEEDIPERNPKALKSTGDEIAGALVNQVMTQALLAPAKNTGEE